MHDFNKFHNCLLKVKMLYQANIDDLRLACTKDFVTNLPYRINVQMHKELTTMI